MGPVEAQRSVPTVGVAGTGVALGPGPIVEGLLALERGPLAAVAPTVEGPGAGSPDEQASAEAAKKKRMQRVTGGIRSEVQATCRGTAWPRRRSSK